MDGRQGSGSQGQQALLAHLDVVQEDPIGSEDSPLAESSTEADGSSQLEHLVLWLRSLEVGTAAASTGEERGSEVEQGLERSQQSPDRGSSKTQRRRRKKKTEFQKEYNQISQRERRREKRRRKRAEKDDDPNKDGDDDDTNEFPMLFMIYLAHERDGSLRKSFPKSVIGSIAGTEAQQVVRSYWQRHREGNLALEFSSFRELVDYVAIKRSEVISLQRRLNVLENTEKHYDEKLRAIDGGLPKGSTTRSRVMNKERFLVIHKLGVVRHAAVVLPLLLVRAAERLEELTVKLNQGRQVDMEWLKVNDLRRGLDEEKERAQLLSKWASTVFPLSGTYNEIVEGVKKAETRVCERERKYKQAMEGLEGKVIALAALEED